MPCQEIQDNLSAYLDGELPSEEARRVEAHVEACPACRRLLRELSAVSGVLGAMPHESAPRGLSDDLQSQLERRVLLAGDDDGEAGAQPDRRLAQERPSRWPRVAAIAACLMLAAGITALWYLPRPDGGGPGAVTPVVHEATTNALDGSNVAMLDTGAGGAGKAGESSIAGVAQARKRDSAEKARAGTRTSSEQTTASDRMADELRRAAAHANGAPALEMDRPQSATRRDTLTGRRADAYGARRAAARTVNTLVIETADLAAGEDELQKILVSHGLTLSRVPAPQSMLESETTSRPSLGDTKGKLAAASQVVYAGAATPKQVALLTSGVVGNRNFRIRKESDGAFVTAAETQQWYHAARQLKAAEAEDRVTSQAADDKPAYGVVAMTEIGSEQGVSRSGKELEASPAVAETSEAERQEAGKKVAAGGGAAEPSDATNEFKTAAKKQAREGTPPESPPAEMSALADSPAPAAPPDAATDEDEELQSTDRDKALEDRVAEAPPGPSTADDTQAPPAERAKEPEEPATAPDLRYNQKKTTVDEVAKAEEAPPAREPVEAKPAGRATTRAAGTGADAEWTSKALRETLGKQTFEADHLAGDAEVFVVVQLLTPETPADADTTACMRQRSEGDDTAVELLNEEASETAPAANGEHAPANTDVGQ